MTEARARRRRVPTETVVEMARLKGLSDGVVAIALTLLVLDIRVPSDLQGRALSDHLLELAPVFAVYLLSFVVIGGAWGAHQRMLGQIERGDGLMVWWTLLSLLPITLVPASAGLLGEHPSEPLAIAVFAIDVIAIEATAWLLWRHASRRGLVDTAIDPRVVSSIGRRHVFSAICFIATIPIALVAIPVVYVIWVATFALIFTTDYLSWQQAVRATSETIALDGAVSARIKLQHGRGSLNLDGGTDAGVLVDGSFGGGLATELERDGDTVALTLKLPGQSALLSPRYPWAWGLANLLDWDASVTTEIPIELELQHANGLAMLHLEKVRLASFTMQASGGSVDLWLPPFPGTVKVLVQASAVSMVVRVPAGAALSIASKQFASSIEVATEGPAFMLTKREYQSPNLASAATIFEIQAEIAAGSLKLVPAQVER